MWEQTTQQSKEVGRRPNKQNDNNEQKPITTTQYVNRNQEQVNIKQQIQPGTSEVTTTQHPL